MKKAPSNKSSISGMRNTIKFYSDIMDTSSVEKFIFQTNTTYMMYRILLFRILALESYWCGNTNSNQYRYSVSHNHYSTVKHIKNRTRLSHSETEAARRIED